MGKKQKSPEDLSTSRALVLSELKLTVSANAYNWTDGQGAL